MRLAETIQQRHPLTPEDALRAARWLMDAGAEIPPELLLDAADAASIGDPELAVVLATRAAEAGAGLGAVRLLARAHTILNRFAEAEGVLAAAEAEASRAAAEGASREDPEVELYVGQRMHLLYWGLRRAQDTRAFLARAERWSSDPGWLGKFEPERIVMERVRRGLRRPTAWDPEAAGEAGPGRPEAVLDGSLARDWADGGGTNAGGRRDRPASAPTATAALGPDYIRVLARLRGR